jgi:hypothetical protein
MWGLQAENQFSISCTKTRTFFMPRSVSAYVGFQNRIRGKKFRKIFPLLPRELQGVRKSLLTGLAVFSIVKQT